MSTPNADSVPAFWRCRCLTINPRSRATCKECGWSRDATPEDHAQNDSSGAES